MPSLVDSLLESHCFTTLEDNFGVVVAIRRGPRQTTLDIPCTWETVTYTIFDNDTGLTTVVESRVYVFKKEDYFIDGKMVEPAVGDLILEPLGTSGLVPFKIMPVAAQQAVMEMPGGYRWRVHTKRVSEC